MVDEIMMDAEETMESGIEALKRDFAGMRTGRASTGLVEKLMVEYYGMPTELRQLATLTTPEAQQIAISPYDKSSIKAIEKAIQNSDLGINPNNDGSIIRLNLPSLTQERRRELSRKASKRAEESRISIRNARRDAISMLRDLQKDKEITEDDLKKGEDDVQKLTNKFVKQIDELTAAKDKEIMAV